MLRFYGLLSTMLLSGQDNAVTGSYRSLANFRFAETTENAFCNQPLEYVLEKSIVDSYSFNTFFLCNLHEKY